MCDLFEDDYKEFVLNELTKGLPIGNGLLGIKRSCDPKDQTCDHNTLTAQHLEKSRMWRMKKLLVYGELANKSSTRTSPLYFSEQAGNED